MLYNPPKAKTLGGFMKKIIIIILVLLIIGASPIIWYNISITPVSDNEDIISVKIEKGSTGVKIAKALKEKNVIKSEIAFRIYIKINNIGDFQFGRYELKQNMEINEIIEALQEIGINDEDEISITFIEGKTMRWMAKRIAEKTNNTEEDVFTLLEDEKYIDSLIEEYWFLTDDIKSKDIYYPLEGYLFPDTYRFVNRNVEVKDIFKTLLKQTEKILNKYKDEIEASEYNVHEIMTIASIVEKEAMRDEDRKDVASVLYNRLEENMSLGCDVTTYYAIKVEVGPEHILDVKEINTPNPYNTRGPNMNGRLPIGPICGVGEKSIEATINSSNTQYLYFVADKNGKVYFTKTNTEHNNKVNELKNSGMWL